MSAKKQSKDKRACIDCHFLTLLQIGGEHYEYPDLDVIPSVIGSNQVPLSFREQIKKKKILPLKVHLMEMIIYLVATKMLE